MTGVDNLNVNGCLVIRSNLSETFRLEIHREFLMGSSRAGSNPARSDEFFS